MQTKHTGLIIFIKCIKDNDLYIKILSSDDEVLSGYVYGGNSLKKRPIYQLCNFIEFNKVIKNYNSIASINAEIVSPFTSDIHNDKFKLLSYLAMVSILENSLLEGQKNTGLFISIKNLVNYINVNEHWLANFCKWLLNYLKLLGYEIDYINNYNMKFFNLNSLVFENIYIKENSIKFPYELFYQNNLITYQTIKSFFKIFETVFLRNHLTDSYNKMPINYLNFKSTILNELNK